MGSIIPKVEINESWHKILLDELNVTECTIEFEVIPNDDKNIQGQYHHKAKRIEIWVHRDLVGRRMTENKKKKIETRILETLLHEYRHHWQYTHSKGLVASSFGVDYYKKPIEIDARAYAKSAKSRYRKLVNITK
jgi:hypothetical protein